MEFCRKKYFFFLGVFGLTLFFGLILPGVINAQETLSCTVQSSPCTGDKPVEIFQMYNTINAHAALPGQGYTYRVCCGGVTGLGNSCSGIHAVVGTLSSTTNAHFEQNDKTNYSSDNDVCLSVTSGGVSIAYQSGSCTGYDTTVASMSGTSGTNAHVGNADPYTTKICATIDNTPPANVSSVSGSAGNEQVTLSWTNPDDGDYHSAIVLRRANSAVTDAPTDGTTYNVNDTIASSTVACVVNKPTAGCIDSGLTNGTPYHYKIFSRDNYVNYASGVVPANSPFTPVEPSTYGNIDLIDKYAWGENVGWMNWRPSYGGVTVDNDCLFGYIWAENIGWINLGDGTPGAASDCNSGVHYVNDSASDFGVNNDGSGNLSGYAWSENTGWINFKDTSANNYHQVVINSSGEFTGYAWGENIGWISMNCANISCVTVDFKVKTSWTTGAAVSITVEPTTFDYGAMPFNNSKESFNTAGALKGKNIKATVGTVITNLNIKGATTTDWTLGTVAANVYAHKFATSTDEITQPTGYTALTLNYEDNVLATDVATSSDVWFGLEIFSPLSGATTTQSVPVTIRAVEAGL